jgi:putative nucleotidyltransferase with HDIG domain
MIKKIRIEHLDVGMYVADFNTPWFNHPFLSGRKKIRNARDIKAILEHGIYELYIDTAKGRDSSRAVPIAEAGKPLLEDAEPGPDGSVGPLQVTVTTDSTTGPPEDGSSFRAELRKAREIYQEAETTVRCLFDGVRLGRGVDGEKARRTVDEMVGSIFRNRDALVSLVRIKNFDHYTLHHCLNVAVLSLVLGAQLGVLDQELQRLGIGAILHDLGKIGVPDRILGKSGPLSLDECEVIKTHAAHGARLLLAAESIPNESATVALNHHERYDGSGYPRGLQGHHIGKFGLITAIADAYDAMTTDRVYQTSMLPHHALKKMYGWAGIHYHPIYVQKFIQCLGIYPVGSVVRLDTGETGVVARQNRDSLLQPWVRIVVGADGSRNQSLRDVDLRVSDPAGEKAFARTIRDVLSPSGSELDVDGILLLPQAEGCGERLTVVLS